MRPVLARMVDAAYPRWPALPFRPDVVNIYLESPHATHSWDAAEWLAAERFARRLNLTYVAGAPYDCAADARSIVNQLATSPLGPIPKGVVISLDVEHHDAAAAQAHGYIPQMAGHFLRDYHVITYCSKTDASRFSEFADEWLGSWTGAPHDLGAAITQYANGTWDSSAIYSAVPFFDPHAPAGGPTLEYPGFAVHPAHGYAQCNARGQVYCYDAPFFGGLKSPPAHPITGMAWSRSGNGYYLFSAGDGGVFAFGDAEYHGHAPAKAQ